MGRLRYTAVSDIFMGLFSDFVANGRLNPPLELSCLFSLFSYSSPPPHKNIEKPSLSGAGGKYI